MSSSKSFYSTPECLTGTMVFPCLMSGSFESTLEPIEEITVLGADAWGDDSWAK